MKLDFSNIHVFEWDELHFIELETEMGIYAFKILISNQEDSLKAIKEKFHETIKNDEELNSQNDLTRGGYYAAFYEREEMAIRELRRQQRYSICISAFSFFEGRLKFLCNQIEKKFDFKIKIDDLNGNDDLKRYWNYLQKVFEIETSRIEPYFTRLQQQKATRNIIAHQEGWASEYKIKNVKEVAGLKIKKIDTLYQIQILETSYLTYLLDTMNSFFKELLFAINRRYLEKIKEIEEIRFKDLPF